MSKTKHKTYFDIKNSLFKGLLLLAGVTDNKDLSKTISGQASRYSLAFFVPKFRPASQATDTKAQTHHPKSLGANHHNFMADLPAVYDGVTLQNKRKPICRAVTNSTESEPHHPMTFHSVNLTQKLLGGYHA